MNFGIKKKNIFHGLEINRVFQENKIKIMVINEIKV